MLSPAAPDPPPIAGGELEPRRPSLATRLAVDHPGACVLFALLVLAAALWANGRVFALRGGILDDALPAGNVYREMDEAVRAKAPLGFEAGEIVPIVVRLPAVDAPSLRRVIEITREATRVFGRRVTSLATLVDYRDDGSEITTDPHLTDDVLDSFDAEAWKARVAADPTAYGIFVAKDWSWASVALLLAPGYDEVAEAWRIVEFVEGRSIPEWERFFRGDVVPRTDDLSVAGWVMGRWQIGQGINRDLMLFVAVGVVVAIPVCWWYLRSLRQAIVCSLVIAIGILLTRASIWLVHAAGFGTFERVYTELAYANVIVQGTSFSLHRFEAFREARGATAREKFVAGAHIMAEIRLVMVIALAGFACLFTFPVWQMREMAVQSMTGVLILGVEVAILLPALYLWIERRIGAEDLRQHFHPAEGSFARVVSRLRAPAWLAWSAPPAVFALGAALFVAGGIPTRTLPEEYIAGTEIADTFTLFARSGSGNEFLDVLVEPREGDVRDPRFLAAAWALERGLRGGPGDDDFVAWQRERGLEPVRPLAVGSILGKIHQVARETYGTAMPATALEAEDAFFLVEDELAREVRSQLWFDGGIRLLVSTQMNDSRELEALVERTLAYAEARHGGVLRATVFGKAPVYPEVDAYVTEGAPSNVFVSLSIIFAIYTVWIAWRARALAVRPRIRAWVGGWAMVAPFVFSAGVMAIVMAVLEVPLSMSTAAIGDLAINAAGDFSVFFVSAFLSAFAFRRELRAALERTCTRESIVVSVDCLLNVIAFSPLMLSGFKPVRELGWMMAVMLISTLAGILCFLPALLPATVRPSEEDSR